MNDISNIIKQIQKDIINPEISLETILFKAKALSYYLSDDELKNWVKNELDGYPDVDKLPSYRIIDAPLLGTFTNGVYIQRNRIISLSEVHPDLHYFFGKTYFPQGIAALEEMAKNTNLRSPMTGDWIDLYNVFNAATLSHGHYQLIEAHCPILNTSVLQISGVVRSRLQDFILEISDLSWDIEGHPLPIDEINKIFHFTIYNSGKINMSNFQKDDGDTYNVEQAGAVGRYARSDGNTFIQSEEKRTLAEAAGEIQNLLKQLERTNPNATQSDMVAYVNDETTPSLKRRTVAAVKACGESAIDEYVLENKLLKVIKATVKGWLEAGS